METATQGLVCSVTADIVLHPSDETGCTTLSYWTDGAKGPGVLGPLPPGLLIITLL